MLKLTFTLMVLFAGLASSSQAIDSSIVKNYPTSVTIKLYDVVTKIPLSTVQQRAVAQIFKEEEDLLKGLILTGANDGVIDSVKHIYLKALENTVTPTKYEIYLTAKVEPKAKLLAEVTARMIKDKFHADSTLERYIRDIYVWRETFIEKAFLRPTSLAVRRNNLLYAAYVYDTLLSNYVYAASSSRFFAIRIHKIDSLTNIPASKKQALASLFFNACIQDRTQSYSDHFKRAFSATFNKIEDSAIYAAVFADEIRMVTESKAQSALAAYIKMDKLSPSASMRIAPFVYERERAFALVNKIIPSYNDQKDQIFNSIYTKYQPAIDSIISLDGRMINASQIDIAIKFSEDLQISGDQLLQLKEALSELHAQQEKYRTEDPVGEFDSKIFESEVLNNVLSPDQYTDVLTIKYSRKAEKMAEIDWKEIRRIGLDVGGDERSVKEQLRGYHLAIIIAYYRNANDIKTQHLSIQRINEVMPEAMRLLLERWEYNTPYGDTPDTFFQW